MHSLFKVTIRKDIERAGKVAEVLRNWEASKALSADSSPTGRTC
jgi:hypothetical protein